MHVSHDTKSHVSEDSYVYYRTLSHMSMRTAMYITGYVTPRIATYHMTLSHMSVKIATYIT